MLGRGKDILIVGAGPAGLTAAIELARRGFWPRIIDNDEGPVPLAESRALGVNARTFTLLSPSGATEWLAAEAQDIRHFRMRSQSKLLADVDTHRVAGRFSAVHGLSQGQTERILLKTLDGYGIQPEWRTAIESLETTATPLKAVLRRADGSSETATADIIIGTDGAHSVVRKALGLGFPGQALDAHFYLADFRYEAPIDTSFAEIKLFDPGMIGRLPVAADTLRFISTMADFESRIEHPAAIAERAWSSNFQIHFRHVEAMSRGNVFLAGDAAHIHSPAGARGMNLGIEDACWLAYLIAEGREGSYSEQRLPAVHHVLQQTRNLTRLVTMHNPVLVALRDSVAPLALGVPAASGLLLRSVAGYDTPKPPWIDWAE